MNAIRCFRWRSSYAGEHHHEAHMADQSIVHLHARNYVPPRSQYSGLTDEQYERSIAGKLGYYSSSTDEQLPLEFCAAFAADSYRAKCESVAKIKAKPHLYGDYIPEKFVVMLPAVFDGDVGWKAIYTFDQIVTAAGIPADECCVLTSSEPSMAIT